MGESFSGNENEQLTPTQKIIESVMRESPEKRVAKLVELGVLTDIEGYTWGNLFEKSDRFFVFANIQGIPVPMYKSSEHTGYKRRDLNFFIFWGVLDNKHNWIIKGNNKAVNKFYGIKELEDISFILTYVFNFDTSEVDEPENKQKGYVPEGKGVLNYKKLNELLAKRFNINFSELNSTGHFPSFWHHDTASEEFLNEYRKLSSTQN